MKEKILIVLLCTFCLYAKAQIRFSEACFYLEAGMNPSSDRSVWEAVYFKGNKAYLRSNGETLYTIQGRLKKDENW